MVRLADELSTDSIRRCRHAGRPTSVAHTNLQSLGLVAIDHNEQTRWRGGITNIYYQSSVFIELIKYLAQLVCKQTW